MKEFLKGLWGLFVFVMLVAGMFAKCEADRIKQQRIEQQRINEWRNPRVDYSPPKSSATPQFHPYLSDYPKIPPGSSNGTGPSSPTDQSKYRR